ncbi:hypothetical protein JXE04_00795 [Patescibacteria group bacterium]|nr:hypothetical protein [Patescibacteria group bacterium]
MKNKFTKISVILLILSIILFNPGFILAQENSGVLNNDTSPLDMLQNVASDYGPYSSTTNENSLMSIAGLVINAALGLLGIIFIILMVLAGYNWMTASGSEEKVKEAKDTIKRAIIGLVIVIGSWAIWTFILENLIANL